VAEAFGVSRQAVHRWLRWYSDGGLAGLADGSHRRHEHPWQVDPAVEVAICEMRRDHPRWGKRRLEFELGRQGGPGPIPSQSTIYRVLVRHNFHQPGTARPPPGGLQPLGTARADAALATRHRRRRPPRPRAPDEGHHRGGRPLPILRHLRHRSPSHRPGRLPGATGSDAPLRHSRRSLD
jgi:hypothetical protein